MHLSQNIFLRLENELVPIYSSVFHEVTAKNVIVFPVLWSLGQEGCKTVLMNVQIRTRTWGGGMVPWWVGHQQQFGKMSKVVVRKSWDDQSQISPGDWTLGWWSINFEVCLSVTSLGNITSQSTHITTTNYQQHSQHQPRCNNQTLPVTLVCCNHKSSL